jgi:hypothetical protein
MEMQLGAPLPSVEYTQNNLTAVAKTLTSTVTRT